MLSNNHRITSLRYADLAADISTHKGITLDEAKRLVSKSSFKEYCQLVEASAGITPPSGAPLSSGSGPATNNIRPQISQQSSTTTTTQPSTTQPSTTQPSTTQPATSRPMTTSPTNGITKPGVAVSVTGPDGKVIQGVVSQVDDVSSGIKVKNTVTGQDEWYNTADVVPADGEVQEDGGNDLQRLRELAGIKEDGSDGGTCSGSIATAPASVSNLRKRITNEQPKTEYTPSGPAKTIIGDTKPSQASGKLSADLAARGQKTASRINNGAKR